MDILIVLLIASFLIAGLCFIKAKKKGLRESTKAYIHDMWLEISYDTDLRHQVLQADSLLDYTLTQAGYGGKGLGNKLKTYPFLFSDLDGLWKAHKLRNTIAHELGFKPTKKQATEAMSDFKRALNDLRAGLK